MCWLTPKSLDGSSENAEIDKFGFSSQSLASDRREEVEKDRADDTRKLRYTPGDLDAMIAERFLFCSKGVPLRRDLEQRVSEKARAEVGILELRGTDGLAARRRT